MYNVGDVAHDVPKPTIHRVCIDRWKMFHLSTPQKKSPDLSLEALCWHYLSFWVGQRIVVA